MTFTTARNIVCAAYCSHRTPCGSIRAACCIGALRIGAAWISTRQIGVDRVGTFGIAAILCGVALLSTNPSLAANNGNTTFVPAQVRETPSFFGQKEIFYQFAPHTRKEDLLQSFQLQPGVDGAVTYVAPVQSGTTLSGRAPTVTTPTSSTQALQVSASGEPIVHPFIQKEISLYADPLLNNWGPPIHGIPFLHALPHDPPPSGMNPQSFKDAPYLSGATFASDLVQHSLRLAAAQRTAEKILDPNLQSAEAAYQGAAQQAADATAGDAGGAFEANMNTAASALINVANEQAATPAKSKHSARTMSQAVWIVQQMHKAFFVPLGLLLLLVGAVITQTTNYVKVSFVNSSKSGPLEGILRAFISVFLIGSIQLIVSYFIDFGNAMTATIKPVINLNSIEEWSQDITNPTRNMTAAQIDARNKSESTAGATTRVVFGTAQALLNTALMVLTVYQLIMVCYLYLLGPIAAAMFAWPEGVGTLFRPVFSNWLNGLSDLVLWRFWWCVILLCMATRIQWLKDIGSYNSGSAWEPIVYTAFMVMLTYVPFAALDFRPGDMVDSLLEKAAANKG